LRLLVSALSPCNCQANRFPRREHDDVVGGEVLRKLREALGLDVGGTGVESQFDPGDETHV
jgi:hypothetical protein